MHILITGGFSLFWWIVFILLFRKDRSRYRNCYALFLALLSLFPLILVTAGPDILLILIFAIILSIMVVPFFLIHNGIVMIRKEGKHLSQLLSLAMGILILAGEIITFEVPYTIGENVAGDGHIIEPYSTIIETIPSVLSINSVTGRGDESVLKSNGLT